MRRTIPSWVFAPLAVLIVGCATTRYEEYGARQPKESGARTASSASLISIRDSLRLTDQEARLSRLEAEMGVRLSDVEAASGDLATRMMALSEQMVELRKQLEAARGAPEYKAPVPAPSGNANSTYERALIAYNDRQYDGAKAHLRQVLALEPEGELADNAQYWLGECDYALGEYRPALEAFEKVFLYEKTEKDDDAQLMMGKCYLHLKDNEKALVELKRLTVDYPDSEYYDEAQMLIRNLRSGTEMEP